MGTSTESFGILFEALRSEQGFGLREFCHRYGFDPGNVSRLERGVMPPPRSEEVLARYAEAFGLEPGSEGWMVFHDLAAAARGEIPRDLMAHREVLGRLPTIYRELRAELVSASSGYELGESFLEEHGE